MIGSDLLLIVGSYTSPYGTFRARGEGLSLVAMRPDGSLRALDVLTLPNPAYLRPAPGLIHVALELDTGASAHVGVEINRTTLRLREVVRQGVPGSLLCHLDLDASGRWIAGACYGSGHVVVRPVAGGAGGTCLVRHGSSLHPQRQASAHPHAARFSPDGRWLVVPDLGTDEVACYPFDARDGTLGEPRVHSLHGGPRLALFAPGGRFLVLVHELGCAVSSFTWENGSLRLVATRPALGEPYNGANTTAGLRWHPSGRSFAVSNRGADRISLFRFDPKTGDIELACEHPSGGAKPRDFEFAPNGHHLIVANQDGDSLVVLAVDERSLALGTTGRDLTVRSPSCVRFAL